MAIYTERIIRVNNNKASMDKDIYIYRGNRNIEIQFTIVDHQFKFKDTNMVEKLTPSHAYVTLLTPQMKQIGTGKAEVIDGVIKLVVSSAMIDEKTECGEYSIVIDLYDEVGDSVLTIPPVENQLHVLDRMTEIDEIPDELRFVFDEQTGNLNVVNIDLTYDGNGEIKTIEGIPISDDKARKIMSDLIEEVDEFSANFNPALQDISKAKEDIARIDAVVTELSDNGYSQIKADMNQTQIQSVLNNGGLILFRAGTYNLEAALNLVSNTRILAETRVELAMSGGNAVSLNDISDVYIDGNLILNGAGFSINDCTDVVINNLCVNAAENGLVLVGGDNVVINNLVTQECSVAGCRISNVSSAMNVILDNHIDIQSTKALDVLTDSNVGLAGIIRVIKPFYEVSEEVSEPCIKLSNSINAPKVIVDRATIQANVDKDIIISIIKEDDNTQKLGNIEIVEPNLMGEGEVGTFIKVNNTISPGDIARIKLIRPEQHVNGEAVINIVDNVVENRSVYLDLDGFGVRVVSEDITLSNDICSMYILPSESASNRTINLDNAPINFECEFINKSSTKVMNISATNIDNKNKIELKYNDYMRIKHLGEGRWTILDENFKNKLQYIYSMNGILSIINARYLCTTLSLDTTFKLPDISDDLAEIHLFVKPTDSISITYPEGIKWTSKEPLVEGEGVYEFILTKADGVWLIGCVSYV